MVPPRLSLIWHDSAEGRACGQSAFANQGVSAHATGARVMTPETPARGGSKASTPLTPSPDCGSGPVPARPELSSRKLKVDALSLRPSRKGAVPRSAEPRDIRRNRAHHGSVIVLARRYSCARFKNALESVGYKHSTGGRHTCLNPRSSSPLLARLLFPAAWQPTASARSAVLRQVPLLLTQPIRTWLQALRSARWQAPIATTQVFAAVAATKPRKTVSASKPHNTDTLTGGQSCFHRESHSRHRSLRSGGVLRLIPETDYQKRGRARLRAHEGRG